MQLVCLECHEFLWGIKKRFKICNKLVKTPETFLNYLFDSQSYTYFSNEIHI